MNQKLLQPISSITPKIVKLVTYWPCCDVLKIAAGAA